MIATVSEWIAGLPPEFVLALVFLCPALEASTFLGVVFPGEIAVIIGGAIASAGSLPLGWVILAACLGAVIGDSLGYLVGRRWGEQMLLGAGKHLPFIARRIDRHLEAARAFMQRNGGKAVFIGRFTAIFRALVPGLAGMSHMRYRRFLAYNVTGGVLWATGFVLLGYIAHAAWQRVAKEAGEAGLFILVVVIAVIAIGRWRAKRIEA